MKPSDDGRRSVSERVVAAVGRELGESPTDLSPLYHAVDTEALDALFPAPPDESPVAGDSARRFTFTYEGLVVDVAADGAVELAPADSDRSRGEPTTRATSTAPTSPESPD